MSSKSTSYDSNREKFKDNPLSKCCITIMFDSTKDENKVSKITKHIPLEDLQYCDEVYGMKGDVIGYKFYKIPNEFFGKKNQLGVVNTEEYHYFEIYGLKSESSEKIQWCLSIQNGESIVDDGDEYMLEMELLSFLLYEGYKIP